MTDQVRIRKALDNKEWADKWRTVDSLKLLWGELGIEYDLGDLMGLIQRQVVLLRDTGAFHSERYDNPDKMYLLAISNLLKDVGK